MSDHTQAMEALALANEIRTGRASLKRSVAAGTAHLADQIEAPAPIMEKVSLEVALTWPDHFGPVRAKRVLRLAGVSGHRLLGRLTDHEREALTAALIEIAGRRV